MWLSLDFLTFFERAGLQRFECVEKGDDENRVYRHSEELDHEHKSPDVEEEL